MVVNRLDYHRGTPIDLWLEGIAACLGPLLLLLLRGSAGAEERGGDVVGRATLMMNDSRGTRDEAVAAMDCAETAMVEGGRKHRRVDESPAASRGLADDMVSCPRPSLRMTPRRSTWLSLGTLVAAPLAVMAQSCISLAGSTACSAFSTASVSTNSGLVSI